MTENGNDARSNNFLSLFYMVKMHGYLYFQMYLLGKLFGIVLLIVKKRSDMFDALSMYRPSEIILPEGNCITARYKRLYG